MDVFGDLLKRLLTESQWEGAAGLLHSLTWEADAVAPGVESLVADLASRWVEEGPVFGVDPEAARIDTLVHLLLRLGPSGGKAVVRLLYSQHWGVAHLASNAILASPDRVGVDQVLRAMPEGGANAAPWPVFALLAQAPSSPAEWAATLALVGASSSDVKWAFLNRMEAELLPEPRVGPLVEALLLWTFDESHVDECQLEILDKLAPDDERVRALRGVRER